MNVLCDTNAITALRLGNKTVLSSLEEAEKVLLSVIVLGELLFGYAKGSRERENREFLQAFLEKPSVCVLPVDRDTARVYAQLRVELHKAGTPIPTNDLWIASQAIASGSALISNDRHYSCIIGLYRIAF